MTSYAQSPSVNMTARSARQWILVITALVASTTAFASGGETDAPAGWTTAAPREEIRPKFSYDAHGGRDGRGALVIAADGREGRDGWWTRTFPVRGGRYFRFQAVRKTESVTLPRQTAVVRIVWQDDAGQRCRSMPRPSRDT